MAATIRQVAQHAGVSTSTVSHVLNGTHYVSPELTARVLKAVEVLNYELNPIARRLAGGRSNVIGLFIPDFGLQNDYIVQIVNGIDEELVTAEYDFLIHSTHRRGATEASGVRALTRGLTEGLLLLLPTALESYIPTLQEENFPYVIIDQHATDDQSTTVVATNFQGAYDATEYLIKMGHQRIAHVYGTLLHSSAQERMDGYQAALAAYNLPVDPALMILGDFDLTRGYQATQKLLSLPEPPTAIFMANDRSALGAIDAIHERGLSIPDDISLVGFDDAIQSRYTSPRLTTVRQPMVEMGRRAARMLLAYIENPELPAENVILPTELLIRESCQPPR